MLQNLNSLGTTDLCFNFTVHHFKLQEMLDPFKAMTFGIPFTKVWWFRSPTQKGTKTRLFLYLLHLQNGKVCLIYDIRRNPKLMMSFSFHYLALLQVFRIYIQILQSLDIKFRSSLNEVDFTNTIVFEQKILQTSTIWFEDFLLAFLAFWSVPTSFDLSDLCFKISFFFLK